MGYYIAAVIGAMIGYSICALINVAADADAAVHNRCGNCQHCRPIPDHLLHHFEGDAVVCAACRGEAYELDIEGGTAVSIVSAFGFCDEFRPIGERGYEDP